jgi:2-oxoglutarate dehydrogenase E2 component (dihydrolipoamide succinyltransferase)
MGESIAEGTIVRWIKKVGEAVDRDEPLFEISTDKVDAEIPAPAAGVLTEIKVKEGETVAVNSVVATIGSSSEAATPEPAANEAVSGGHARDAEVHADIVDQPHARPPAPPRKANGRAAAASKPVEEDSRKQRSSPLVRRIARDNDVDISHIHGSGLGGRVTKQDILEYIENGGREPAAVAQEPMESTQARSVKTGERVEVKPLSVMRRKIAEHMVLSKRTSAHVHSVFEVDYTRVSQIREAKKGEFERAGVKLTYMAFIAKAIVDGLRATPVINASIDGDNVVHHKSVNLGIAVALDWGLIVPVVKQADEKNVLGLARAIADLGTRARAKQLKPEEVQGGTFTITNPGGFGSLFGMPIINQPQVAILGVGAIEKRPVVINDAIAIRTMGYLTLGYDHRLVDGAVADQFMAGVRQQLENFDSAAL